MIRQGILADRKKVYDVHSSQVSVNEYDEMERYFSYFIKPENLLVKLLGEVGLRVLFDFLSDLAAFNVYVYGKYGHQRQQIQDDLSDYRQEHHHCQYHNG